MRLSVVLLLLSLAGVAFGGWLIGRQALGAAVIADSIAVGAFAWFRDDESRAEPSVHEAPTLSQVLERARRSA